jgi:predicted nuclease with TOPRIM domain
MDREALPRQGFEIRSSPDILQVMEEDAQSRLERIMETGFATLADLMRETNSRLDETNNRLDETNHRLERLESCFDNFLSTAGGETRELRDRVRDLETRVDKLERD